MFERVLNIHYREQSRATKKRMRKISKPIQTRKRKKKDNTVVNKNLSQDEKLFLAWLSIDKNIK